MATTVISGDLHGRLAASRELFERVGMIRCVSDDPFADERQPGFRHIQLGDAVSLGYGEVEAEFYRWLIDVVGVDELLLGNHELPVVWWDPRAVMFQGYYDRDEIRREVDQPDARGTGDERADRYAWEIGRDRDAEQLVRAVASAGRFQVATSVGEWLITHAGLSAEHERAHDLVDRSSAEVAEYLNELFISCQATARPESVLDSRSQSEGGIMWHRIDYLRQGYDDDTRSRHQVVGHSGYLGPRQFGSRLWLIDMPVDETASRLDGGVAALITEDDGATLRLIQVDATPRP